MTICCSAKTSGALAVKLISNERLNCLLVVLWISIASVVPFSQEVQLNLEKSVFLPFFDECRLNLQDNRHRPRNDVYQHGWLCRIIQQIRGPEKIRNHLGESILSILCLFVSLVLQLTEIWGLIQTFVFAWSEWCRQPTF